MHCVAWERRECDGLRDKWPIIYISIMSPDPSNVCLGTPPSGSTHLESQAVSAYPLLAPEPSAYMQRLKGSKRRFGDGWWESSDEGYGTGSTVCNATERCCSCYYNTSMMDIPQLLHCGFPDRGPRRVARAMRGDDKPPTCTYTYTLTETCTVTLYTFLNRLENNALPWRVCSYMYRLRRREKVAALKRTSGLRARLWKSQCGGFLQRSFRTASGSTSYCEAICLISQMAWLVDK